MRLSNFAQDSLLSMIYRIEEVEAEERTVMEQNILTQALKFDRERAVEGL